ncbi:MAG: S-methyl-5-thioribose-1-phosphate isomerase [Candidatus Omnitrophota bacterium]
MADLRPFYFKKNVLRVLDQTELPGKEHWISCRQASDVHHAIRSMAVRGAPAIGLAAAYGLYLGVRGFRGGREDFFIRLEKVAEELKRARPTGVNLQHAVDAGVRYLKIQRGNSVAQLQKKLLAYARVGEERDRADCKRMGRIGARLFRTGARLLTYCNAGGYATSGYGTALGVIYACKQSGKQVHVFACETRPYLQGARLTALELRKSGIPVTLICDNMAASLMTAGRVDGVVVGADRIALNGDTANKIGTYALAVLARYHHIPFYVAAPLQTFDFKIGSGKDIPIEIRPSKELTHWRGKAVAASGIKTWNPSFDVTPAELITAFITERGLVRPPYSPTIRAMKRCDDG